MRERQENGPWRNNKAVAEAWRWAVAEKAALNSDSLHIEDRVDGKYGELNFPIFPTQINGSYN